MKLRFAPSPTGLLHVGNIRTALFNYLLSCKSGGEFLLRLDDTDTQRSKDEYKQAVKDDLQWLGIKYESVFYQSDRIDRYNQVKENLISSGRLYPCYETSDELERKRKRLLSRGKPPIYDRFALKLKQDDIEKFESEGRKPHWRFKLNSEEIIFDDMIRGEVRIHADTISDPVLIRADGSYLYTLCSVIDDADYDITHIVRGEDHVTNTAVQIQIFEAIGAKIPTFAHHPLLTDENGEKLSKRLGSLSIRGLHESGIESLSILSYLARIGTSDPVEPKNNIDDIINGFDITRTSNSAARFVQKDLENLNHNIIASYSFKQIKDRIVQYAPKADENFWNGIKNNIKTLECISIWNDIIYKNPESSIDENDIEYIKIALEALPSDKWSLEVWKKWTNILKEKTGRKGKSLFMPLRQVLTGMPQGPEMEVIIMLLGRDKVINRLNRCLDLYISN